MLVYQRVETWAMRKFSSHSSRRPLPPPVPAIPRATSAAAAAASGPPPPEPRGSTAGRWARLEGKKNPWELSEIRKFGKIPWKILKDSERSWFWKLMKSPKVWFSLWENQQHFGFQELKTLDHVKPLGWCSPTASVMVSCLRSFLHPFLGKQTQTTMQKNATRYIGTFPTNLSCKTMGKGWKGSIKVGLIQQFHSWIHGPISKTQKSQICQSVHSKLLESRDPAKFRRPDTSKPEEKKHFAPPPSLFPRKKKRCPPPPSLRPTWSFRCPTDLRTRWPGRTAGAGGPLRWYQFLPSVEYAEPFSKQNGW